MVPRRKTTWSISAEPGQSQRLFSPRISPLEIKCLNIFLNLAQRFFFSIPSVKFCRKIEKLVKKVKQSSAFLMTFSRVMHCTTQKNSEWCRLFNAPLLTPTLISYDLLNSISASNVPNKGKKQFSIFPSIIHFVTTS